MFLASAVAEPLHRQLFGLIEGMIRQGRKADVRTLKSSTSQVISPNGLTAGEYIARCAAAAVSLRPEDVGRYAHEVILLAIFVARPPPADAEARRVSATGWGPVDAFRGRGGADRPALEG